MIHLFQQMCIQIFVNILAIIQAILCIQFLKQLETEQRIMSENQNYMQQLLLNIQYELMDIDHLQPGQFIKNIMCQPIHGIQQNILNFIRQAIHQYQTQRAIIKYIKIIDKLIKYPNFLPAVQNAIIDIYSDLFMFLLIQKCHNQIQQIKILRKYWVGSIHPYVLNQIKENLLHKHHIDIDSGFKPDKIARIKQYYQNKLKMNAQALNQHLPYIGTTLEINKTMLNYNSFNPSLSQPQRYNVETPKNSIMFNQNNGYNPVYNHNGHINNYNTGMYQQYNQIQVNIQHNPMKIGSLGYNDVYNHIAYSEVQNNIGYLDVQNQGSYYVDRQNYHNKTKSVSISQRNSSQRAQVMEEININKRKRMASEETRVAGTPTIGASLKEGSVQGSSIQEEIVQSKGRKLIHRDQVMIDHKYMLLKLKRLNSFCCKQCGLQFISDENLSIHRNEHIKQKLIKNEKVSRFIIKPNQLSSAEEWVCDKQQKRFEFDQFCIPVPQQFIGQILCNFCCSQLHLQFRNNQWVYSNATQVKLQHRTLIMHKSCQIVLQTTKNTDDN